MWSFGVLIFWWNSDSGLKSDTDPWTCVIVTVYWVNDADRQIPQIATNKRPRIRGLVYYALSIISLYSVRLWKQVRPMRSPFFWQDSWLRDFNKLWLWLRPWARIQTPGTPHPWFLIKNNTKNSLHKYVFL